MGLFDEVEVRNVVCPECKKEFDGYMQTKEFPGVLQRRFNIGSKAYAKFRFVNGLIDCPNCYESPKQCEKCGHWISEGHKTLFHMRVYIDEGGNITDNHIILETNNGTNNGGD
jgi:hypothetical protein